MVNKKFNVFGIIGNFLKHISFMVEKTEGGGFKFNSKHPATKTIISASVGEDEETKEVKNDKVGKEKNDTRNTKSNKPKTSNQPKIEKIWN